ncbi:diacylglycerol kinase 5 isoform X1 [Senna tora]|uniref:Diacylglycerol kinase 5 isoform X1 n=1 Tax=Senna tora TaxID=362788 RepID=A0A834X6I3_9FABA|nr:diacylglycerol kinase 5 isoform X1 [Senna tora]
MAEPKRKGGAVIVTSRMKEVARKIVGGDDENNIKLIDLNPWNYRKDVRFVKGMVEQEIRERGVSVDAEMVSDIVRLSHGLPHVAVPLPNVVAKGLKPNTYQSRSYIYRTPKSILRRQPTAEKTTTPEEDGHDWGGQLIVEDDEQPQSTITTVIWSLR